MTAPSIDRNLAALFLKFLHADHEGWACLAVKDKEWRQEFYHWPDEQDALLDSAMRHAPEADIYVGMLLYSEKRRGKDTALPGRVLWCDVDHPLTTEQEVSLRYLPSRVVDSGTPGHSHVYVLCSKRLELGELEGLNQGLSRFLGGDVKWSAEVVLRLPGTLNHKNGPMQVGGCGS